MSMLRYHQHSAVNHRDNQLAEVRDCDETLWAVCFEGRVRVSVLAATAEEAETQGRLLMPGLLILKVFPR